MTLGSVCASGRKGSAREVRMLMFLLLYGLCRSRVGEHAMKAYLYRGLSHAPDAPHVLLLIKRFIYRVAMATASLRPRFVDPSDRRDATRPGPRFDHGGPARNATQGDARRHRHTPQSRARTQHPTVPMILPLSRPLARPPHTRMCFFEAGRGT